MPYQVRHAGSPKMVEGLSAERIAEGLRDGRWDPTDEVRASGATAWQALESHPHFAEVVEDLEAPPPRQEEPTNLDLNALIDVCLVLLIFFMLTTTYAVAVQKVVPVPPDKTESSGARKVSAAEVQQMVRVRAYPDGRGKLAIQVQNTTRDVIDAEGNVDKAKLAEELRREAKGDIIRTEMLLDAGDITWGTFIAIQDAARSAGIEKIRHKK
jgi:biopolymer transport protein ExbD